MAAPFNDLESKLEAAMLALVNTLTLTVGADEEALTKNTGLDDDAFGVPNVICYAEVGSEYVKDSGNFVCQCRVTVTSHPSDTTLANHRARVATVRDAFMDDGLAATLSANGTDFHCLTIERRSGMRHEIASRDDGKVMKSTMEFEAVCCGSDIS